MKLYHVIQGLGRRGLLNWMTDKAYIQLVYMLRFGKRVDFKNPKTFNEKLQWLKLNDRQDIYTTMVDKYEVKKYIEGVIGKKYIIPTIGVYDCFDNINISELPDQFVAKCTHDSGSVVIVSDKATASFSEIEKKLSRALKYNGYCFGREWPYKNVKPRIIIEKFMDKPDSTVDYKFFCFNGKPEIVLACSDRFSSDGLKETWFDSEWNLLPVVEGGHRIDKNLKKPKKYDEMKKLAGKLAKDITFVRIDFYEFGDKVFFGEITFFPASGFERFDPECWNEKLGEMIQLKVDERDKKMKTRKKK